MRGVKKSWPEISSSLNLLYAHCHEGGCLSAEYKHTKFKIPFSALEQRQPETFCSVLEAALGLPCCPCSWLGLQLVGQAWSSARPWSGGVLQLGPRALTPGAESTSQAPLEIPWMPSQGCLTSELTMPDGEEELSFKNRSKISTRPKHASPVCLFKLIPAEKAVSPTALSDGNFTLRSPCELWQRSKRYFKTNTELMSRGSSLRRCLYRGKNVSRPSYCAHLQHKCCSKTECGICTCTGNPNWPPSIAFFPELHHSCWGTALCLKDVPYSKGCHNQNGQLSCCLPEFVLAELQSWQWVPHLMRPRCFWLYAGKLWSGDTLLSLYLHSTPLEHKKQHKIGPKRCMTSSNISSNISILNKMSRTGLGGPREEGNAHKIFS